MSLVENGDSSLVKCQGLLLSFMNLPRLCHVTMPQNPTYLIGVLGRLNEVMYDRCLVPCVAHSSSSISIRDYCDYNCY